MMTRYRIAIALSLALAAGCAAPMYQPGECRINRVTWIRVSDPDAQCRVGGAFSDDPHRIKGCAIPSRDGGMVIYTGPVRSKAVLETLGHEIAHWCFGINWHPRGVVVTDKMLERGMPR